MNKSILSVNGNKAMNYLLQTILEKESDFIPVSDVFQAMHVLRREKTVMALIIDLDLQQQQAWELIEHIKSSKLFHLPVIVLATDNDDTLRQKCYEYEVDEIFFKPFNPLDLIAAIKSLTNVTVMTD
jgi:CheY-like chemotaxis protein